MTLTLSAPQAHASQAPLSQAPLSQARRGRRVCVAHQEVPLGSSPDELDTLAQVEAVEAALRALGDEPTRLPLTLDLSRALELLSADPPALVFNLVETLGGVGPALTCAPALFDALALPYTGCGAEALRVTGDKLLARREMRRAGLPVPPAWGEPPASLSAGGSASGRGGARWIVKSVGEHGSLGLSDRSVVGGAEVEGLISLMTQRHGGRWLAEQYIHGREMNISLLEVAPQAPSSGAAHRAPACEVLPLAELSFLHTDPQAPRLLGYEAKWDDDAPEAQLSERRFPEPATQAEARLHAEVRALCARCWDLFGLRGAARVDLRVDEEGRPWLLEVNANPCLAPDAGFMAAAARAGLSFEGVVERLARCALGPPLAEISHVDPCTPTRAPQSPRHLPALTWRREVNEGDEGAIRALVTACGNFSDEEVEIAAELPRERYLHGAASGYELLMAESEGDLLAYACWGRIPGSQSSYDLYWIAAHPRAQGSGVARETWRRALDEIRRAGGHSVYIETSSLPAYAAARSFYLRQGCNLVAIFEDFYALKDHKHIYLLDLRDAEQAGG